MLFQLDLSGCFPFCTVNRESLMATTLETVMKLVLADSRAGGNRLKLLKIFLNTSCLASLSANIYNSV